jgi:putative hydrolase of the HAD superfamily
LDNTLVDRAEGFRLWAQRFVAERSLDLAELPWLEAADGDGFKPRAEFFAEVSERYAISEPIADLVAAYRIDYPQCIPAPSEETRAALLGLRTLGWKIGIVTNGSPTQEAKITGTGLDQLVDGWVISEVVGVRKPEPAIFRTAAEICGCPLRGGWLVGDSAEADIAGAAASELSSAWISRGRTWTEPAYSPTLIAGSVAEAVSAILVRQDSL